MPEESFTLIERSSRPKPHRFYDDVVKLSSGLTADHDFPYVTALREANKGMIVTSVPATSVNLLLFAAAGHATFELDTKTDSFVSWRGYVRPSRRESQGQLGETRHFAKYSYHWAGDDFILYTIANMQYILKEKRGSEDALGPSKATDALIQAAGDWLISDNQVVWVYDGYWRQDKQLYREVQKASWDKVILDEKMKKDLTSVTETFFNSKDIYESLGVPWKRGIMFHGPPGNGKTVSIKALMHSLLNRKDPIPTLYVKSAPYTYNISQVFGQARTLAPCMLILEDIETIVTSATRSYFFNEMDGLAGNDGLFVVASTNYLDRLDPGLTNRPSRFDRKYLFPEPNEHERTLYCEYWRQKLKSNPDIDFPKRLTGEMAKITDRFSFAFLQECFVASLLVIAGGEEEEEEEEDDDDDGDEDDLDRYQIWRIFKKQADILRDQIHGEAEDEGEFREALGSSGNPDTGLDSMFAHEEMAMLNRSRMMEARGSLLPDLGYTGHKMAVFNQSAYEFRAP